MAPSRRQWSYEPQTPAPKEIYNFRVYVLAIVASMGAVMFGYDLAFIGTTMSLKSFERDFGTDKMSASQKNAFSANVVSLLQAGCFFGALAAAPLSDRFGRKIGLIVAALFYIAGSSMQTWAHGSKSLMYAGRAIGGLGVGSASGLVPLFIAEASPSAIRGRLVGMYEIGVQLGTLIGFWINYGVNQHIRSSQKQWMIPFAFQLIPGGLLTIGMFFVPESPRWTARMRGKEESMKVLSRFRHLPITHPYLQEEANAIMRQIEEERILVPKGGIIGECKELFGSRVNRQRIILGTLIFVFMQFAGSNAINYYSPKIFASIGLKGTSTSLISTGVYGSVRFVAVCITMYFLVDYFGRTTLLLVGSVGMAVCMYYIGGFVTVSPATGGTETHLTAGSIIAAIALYVYAVFYCLSWAGIPWIYASEIFPTCIRSLAVSICTAVHWLFNFVIARSVPYMVSNIGGGTYFLFAACLTVSVPFVWFFLPETKGRDLEDMDIVFKNMNRSKYGRVIAGSPRDEADLVEGVADKEAAMEQEEV